MKKPFKESAFGKFLNKAGGVIPEILTVGGKILTGNIGGAIEEVSGILRHKAESDEHAKELLIEFEKYKMTFEKELFELEVEDRKSARSREVEMAKTGRTDYMMYVTGGVGLGVFCVLVYSILFRDLPENALLHQLIGMIEGVAMSIFAYYFGSSKGSKDKDKLINK